MFKHHTVLTELNFILYQGSNIHYRENKLSTNVSPPRYTEFSAVQIVINLRVGLTLQKCLLLIKKNKNIKIKGNKNKQ